MGKAELLAGLREEYRDWETLLEQIGPARMDQPGVAGMWSIKDIVAHLTGWRRRTVGRLRALQRGEPEPPPPWPAQLQTDDQINAWIYESRHGHSVREVLDESDAVFGQLLAAIEALPEEVLAGAEPVPWLEGWPFSAADYFSHFHEEHEPAMRAWLARADEGRLTPVDPLTTIFRHHRWANLRLLERCAGLSGEQLDATVPGTYGSIRDTLQHIVTSEQNYFSRISTGKPLARAHDAPPLTPAEMVRSAQASGAGLIEWAAKVQAGDTVEVDWEGTPRAVPKSILLTQVINHATEHRAQIMTILTQVGIEPPDLQAWEYFDEQVKKESA